MARVKRGVVAHARHKKILKLAKGYVGRSSTNFRPALQRVENVAGLIGMETSSYGYIFGKMLGMTWDYSFDELTIRTWRHLAKYAGSATPGWFGVTPAQRMPRRAPLKP